MSVVNILDRVTEWVQANICAEIQLKAPPESDMDPTDAGYAYRLVTPAAFPLFVPAKDKAPPGVISPIPSVCVRFMKGQDSLSEREGSMALQLCFSTWDPGLHGEDIFHKVEGEAAWRQWDGPEAAAFFKRSAGGWRDAWNLVDIALRKLGNSIEVAGFQLDRETPLEYGTMEDPGAINEAYPLWFAWVSFNLTYPLRRNVEEIETLL